MLRLMRTFAIASLSVLFAIVTLLASAHAAPHAATMNVAAKDFEFDPKTITITVGDTITWTNQGKMPHTVTASDNSFDSGNLASGATFSHTFDKAGTFAYYCKYHGKADGTGMAATVIVQEAGAAQPAAAAQPTAAAAADQATEQNSLEADDQALTNNSVNVKEVYSAQDGWMVIHLDENNAPGKVIGHTAVKKGESTDVKVTLDQPVSAGTKVWPMLHIDAGTSGTYEFPGPDLPAKGADGMVVMKQISLTGGQSAPAKAAPSTLPNTGGDELPLTPLASLAALLIGSGFLAKRARRRS